MADARSAPLLGPEPWKTIGGIQFSTWDLWLMVMSLVGDEIGLDGVEKKLRGQLRRPGGGSDAVEAKLSQLDDLRERLAKLKMTPEDLVLDEVKDKKIVAKARTKVFDQGIVGKALTEAMRDTPRVKLDRRAKVGHWSRFPVSPERYAPDLFAVVNYRDYYNESQGSRLADKLQSRWERRSKKAEKNLAEALALQRAMLTACHAAQERADDSFGEIGQVFTEAIRRYEALPWQHSGIEPEVCIRDIVEFATWENYGQGDELEGIFTQLPVEHGDLAVRIFKETVTELERYDLFKFHVEQALAFWTALLIGQKRFDEFVAMAEKIASSAWRPIVTLAEAAMNVKKPDLALAVFGAANKSGMHQKFLADSCMKLLKKKIPTAGLRLVK
jgi:hypothetical protein